MLISVIIGIARNLNTTMTITTIIITGQFKVCSLRVFGSVPGFWGSGFGGGLSVGHIFGHRRRHIMQEQAALFLIFWGGAEETFMSDIVGMSGGQGPRLLAVQNHLS